MLNRILRWTKGGITCEVGPRHVEIIHKQLDIEMQTSNRPGTEEEGTTKDGDDKVRDTEIKLKDEKLAAYRALAARANYLTPDRPDVAISQRKSLHVACLTRSWGLGKADTTREILKRQARSGEEVRFAEVRGRVEHIHRCGLGRR